MMQRRFTLSEYLNINMTMEIHLQVCYIILSSFLVHRNWNQPAVVSVGLLDYSKH